MPTTSAAPSEVTELERAVAPVLSRRPTTRLNHVVARFSGAIVAAVVACVCLLEILLGTMPTRIYSADLFILLDGAWRVDSGQIPHQDFFAGFSVLLWKPLQLALAITDFDAAGIGIARALFTAVIALWVYLLVRKRLPAVLGLAVTLTVVALVAAARPLGVSASLFSHAMFYNRVGYALVFIVMLEALYLARFWAPSKVTSDRLWFGFSTGLAIASLALLKVSFLVPAVVLLVAGVVLWGTTRRHLLGVAAGGIVVVAVAVLLLDFRPGAWLSEMAELAKAREGSMLGMARDIVRANLMMLALVPIVGVVMALVARLDRALAIRFVAATLVVAGAEVYCRATNAQDGDLPLLALWCLLSAFLIASAAIERGSTSSLPRYLAPAVALATLLVFTAPLVGKDVVSLGGAAYVSTTAASADAPRIDSARLASFTTEEYRAHEKFLNSNGPRLVAITNDGLRLLRQRSRSDESVGSVTSVNRFSYALARPPAPGGAPWIHEGNNFSAANPPDPETLFGRPDVLMVQRSASAGLLRDQIDGSKSLLAVYPDLLTDGQYELVGSSRYWTLYRRTA